MSAHRLPSDFAQAGWVEDTPAASAALKVGSVSEDKLTIGTTAETNTCASPIRAGLLKIITVVSVGSGGSRAITFADPVDQYGTTVLTFSVARQTVVLWSVPDGTGTTGYRWQRESLDSTATSNINSATITNSQLANGNFFGNGATVNSNVGGGAVIGGNANQKLGFFGVTPVVEPSGTGELIGILGFADNSANATNMNSNGNMGNTRYSFNDMVKALKQLGFLKQ